MINYDLAWTPDVLIQRAGRILRFWKTPRLVQFLVFVGNYKQNLNGQQATHKIEGRLRKLTQRSKHAQKFSEIPLLTEHDNAEYNSLADLSSVNIEEFGLVDPTQLEEFTGVSPFLKHLTILKENEDYASTIPDDISSALLYQGAKKLIYLLIRQQGEYFRLIYDIEEESISSIKEDELLDKIQCKKETPLAIIGADELEKSAQKARQLWERENTKSDSEKTDRICALYLIPENKEKSITEML